MLADTGMGGAKNEDIKVEQLDDGGGWEECCAICIASRSANDHDGCKGWTLFTDTNECHLHGNTEDQHPGMHNRITGIYD